ncbi:hypothetical protein BFJ68_g16592 [Fusarium oxysporum]|uniref:Peptidase S8/S53 domain-containing protein n=1 Tax=Fusarium oxysporum TaxID=5507 RepID=A0A420PBW3_FUSOX|nr:hypothetical protein BFJ68_g16592 [Fusarium oxysporum]
MTLILTHIGMTQPALAQSRIIASRTYGVAKKANIIGIKVFSDRTGFMQTSDIIKALNWVISNIYERGIKGRAIVNLSLGGGPSPALDSAVASTICYRVVVCVTAGNRPNVPAKAMSPACKPLAITVGASDRNNAFADFLSFGKMVNIIGPGVNILSCWIGGPDPLSKTRRESGTSMGKYFVKTWKTVTIKLTSLQYSDSICGWHCLLPSK